MVTEKAYAYSIADIVIILREGIKTVGGVIIIMCINYQLKLPSSNKVVCLSIYSCYCSFVGAQATDADDQEMDRRRPDASGTEEVETEGNG